MSGKLWLLIFSLPLLVNCGGMSALTGASNNKASAGATQMVALQSGNQHVYRGVNANGMHIFADDPSTIANAGYSLEGPAFQVVMTYTPGLVGLRRCVTSSGFTFTSTDKGCEGGSTQGAQFLGYISTSPSSSATVGLYRYRDLSGDHMTTRGQVPGLANLGYSLDGLMGYVP